MLRHRHPTAAVLVAITLAAPAAAQDLTVDTAGAGTLIDQALHRSQIMPNLAYLTDIIGPRLTGSTAADSGAQRERTDGMLGRFRNADSATRARRQQYDVDVPFILRNAGALAILVDGAKEHALLTMSGSPRRILPLPQIVIAHEDYALFDRLLAAGSTPVLEANVANQLMADSVPQWNTVAEIRGAEHPGQVVIVGAHLDSWDLGAGATDNGAGAMATLEA